MSELRTAPAGWHRDPNGAPYLRWWDGVDWTPFTMPLTPPPPKKPISGWVIPLVVFFVLPIALLLGCVFVILVIATFA